MRSVGLHQLQAVLHTLFVSAFAELAMLSESFVQEAALAQSNSSSGSPIADSIAQPPAHDLRLLSFSAAASSSSSRALFSAAASIPAGLAAAGDAKQLQFGGIIQLVAFCFFEVLIGMFWPSMMTLRAKYVPEQQRSTIINVFRIPLNLFVCLILWKVSGRSITAKV